MAKSKAADIDTDDIRGMISKWASIPFGIVVVLVAGGALNLIPYFLELKDQLGFEPIHQEFIRWGVLFGYFGGLLAGPLVDMIGTTISFVISALIAGGGFVALAFYSDASSISTFNTILVVSLVLLVSFACAIATIASIATVILNFSRNVGAMVAAVMIAYYFAAPFFDLSVRGGYFEDVELKTNMLVSGGIHFIVYLLAAFIVDENEQSPRLKRASALTDRFGILIYASIAGGFLAVVYFTCIIAEQFKLAIVLITLVILLNFIVLGFTVQALIGKINDSDTSNVADEDIPPKKHFGEMFTDIRYWCLLFGVFVIAGTGGTYYAEAADVAEAVGQPDVADKIDYAYWFSAVAAILGGGLFAAMFNAILNGWIFAAIGAFSSMVGFGLVFLADVHPAFFYTSAFFIGAGVGTWWVVVPQIILDDAGPRSFESLWGMTLTVAAAGMFTFDRFFWWISSKTEPDSKGDCDGSACFLVPYVLSAALCMIAGILAIVGFNNDEGTGGSGGKDERKPLRKNDKNKEKDRGRSKSKDGKRSGSKSKSKGKKSKSKSKK